MRICKKWLINTTQPKTMKMFFVNYSGNFLLPCFERYSQSKTICVRLLDSIQNEQTN